MKLITGHLYDAGFPRDDSKGCIAERGGGREATCGRPLNDHAGSEYPNDDPHHDEDRLRVYPKGSLQFDDDSYDHLLPSFTD